METWASNFSFRIYFIYTIVRLIMLCFKWIYSYGIWILLESSAILAPSSTAANFDLFCIRILLVGIPGCLCAHISVASLTHEAVLNYAELVQMLLDFRPIYYVFSITSRTRWNTWCARIMCSCAVPSRLSSHVISLPSLIYIENCSQSLV